VGVTQIHGEAVAAMTVEIGEEMAVAVGAADIIPDHGSNHPAVVVSGEVVAGKEIMLAEVTAMTLVGVINKIMVVVQ